MSFTSAIIGWYDEFKRELPWRKTSDAYKIWISEIILQQTRVDQGLNYYLRFLEKFPDLKSLAGAPQDDVLKVWQGLGYYSRARHLHDTARFIFSQLGGRFPSTFKELLKLKGVGDYTAAAIASIAFHEPVPVIDGNVLRVLSRYLGIAKPVNLGGTKKQIKEILYQWIDRDQPGNFNQAVMELGAAVCVPGRPKCELCPVSDGCYALANNLIERLPVMDKSKPKQVHHFNYLCFLMKEEDEPVTWLRKRTETGIWRNLYDFPLIETPEENLSEDTLLIHPEFLRLTNNEVGTGQMIRVEDVRHILSHKELHVRFFIIRLSFFEVDGCLKIRLKNIHNYPVSRLIENFLKKVDFDRVYF